MRSCAALVALVVALQPLSPAATEPADRWISGRTSHFTVISNADDRSLERLASNLERFVAVTARLLGTEAGPGAPVTVIAFRDDRSFRPFKPLYRGKPGNISGFFDHSEDGTIIALDISAAREHHPFAVVFHEYTHLLTSEIGRNWPAWVREGLAEFYSTFLVEGDQVTVGIPIADHVRLLRAGRLLALPQILAVDLESPIYNGGNRQSIFYAQAWALIHYLRLKQDPSRPSPLERFLRALTDGRAVEHAFRDTIAIAHPALDSELRAYVSGRVYPVVSYRMDVPPAADQFAVTPLNAAERELQLGRLLLHTDRLDEAEAFLARAHSLNEAAAGPHEALGFLALRRSQPDLAMEHLAQAVARDSRNYLAHYTYADLLFRQAPAARFSTEQARAILDRAHAASRLEPRFLPARHVMARVYLTFTSEADVREGVRMMTDARAAFPADARLALTLGNLQIQLRDYEAAKANLLMVTGSADETLKVQARHLLTQIEDASGSLR